MTPWALGCYNQALLVAQVSAGLVHPRFPGCWNLTVPPGFGEALLGEALECAVRGHSRPAEKERHHGTDSRLPARASGRTPPHSHFVWNA